MDTKKFYKSVVRVCEHCKNEFEDYMAKYKPMRFCSTSCRAKNTYQKTRKLGV